MHQCFVKLVNLPWICTEITDKPMMFEIFALTISDCFPYSVWMFFARTYLFYLFIYLLFSHNKDYTSITLYKDVARGPQKTTRLVRGGPLVTIILSNRTITTHNNGQYIDICSTGMRSVKVRVSC